MINSNFQITSHTLKFPTSPTGRCYHCHHCHLGKCISGDKFICCSSYEIGFAKSVLFMHPNFSTSWMTDSTCLWLTTLKSNSSTILSLCIYERNINALLTNEVMSLQSCKIRCVYRPLLAKLVANLHIRKFFSVYYSIALTH